MNNASPMVSIVMGSTSDLDVMKKAADLLEQMQIPFEIKVISAHRTPELLHEYTANLSERGIKVIIAGAGGAAHLPGVIAGQTTLPVIGVPVKASISIDGWDSILSILQMPPGVPVATVGLDAARNAAILAVQILALYDEDINKRLQEYKAGQKDKVYNAAQTLEKLDYKYMVK